MCLNILIYMYSQWNEEGNGLLKSKDENDYTVFTVALLTNLKYSSDKMNTKNEWIIFTLDL